MYTKKEDKNKYSLYYYNKKIKEYKDYLGGKCIKCGSINNLEFDHINPKEKCFTITKKTTYNWDIIKKELDKCQLLCKECHLKKTRENYPERKHGEWAMIRREKCKCQICKDFFNKYRKQLRLTQKYVINQ